MFETPFVCHRRISAPSTTVASFLQTWNTVGRSVSKDSLPQAPFRTIIHDGNIDQTVFARTTTVAELSNNSQPSCSIRITFGLVTLPALQPRGADAAPIIMLFSNFVQRNPRATAWSPLVLHMRSSPYPGHRLAGGHDPPLRSTHPFIVQPGLTLDHVPLFSH